MLSWFHETKRDLPWRRTDDIYHIWVSEVMLQQTRVETVVAYYQRFLQRFPTVGELAAAPLQAVLKIWEGLGYYARARNLHRAAQMVMTEHDGHIPKEPDVFRRLPGVGDYICAAVMSIAVGYPLPVVDGNVLRVYARWTGLGDDIGAGGTRAAVGRALAAVIPADRPGDFNEAMMELGALVCTPRQPRCEVCPLAVDCYACIHDRVDELPVRRRKPAVPVYDVAVAVIVRAGRLYIQQRRPEGHLGGLWEFPGGKVRDGEEPMAAVVRECREEIGAEVSVLEQLAEVRHMYSHFGIRLRVYVCRLSASPPVPSQPHCWIRMAELVNYPFPAANHKFFGALKQWWADHPALVQADP
ncbi:MAG: A/G-specific adenine glycosylase [Acidobacteria bacterium]|nr:A/G-specific adenine glycosylase [Acidobacteriota bacterium]